MASKKGFIIVGGGGSGREALWIAEQSLGSDFYIKGVLDDNPDCFAGCAVGYDVLGSVDAYEVQEADRFLVAMGDPGQKRKFVQKIREKNGEFHSLIHLSAQIAPSATLGEGLFISQNAIIGPNSNIGNFVNVNVFCSCGHDCSIGAFSTLSPFVAVSGSAVIGEATFVGSNVTIAPKVTVGTNCKISAGSFVLRNVKDNSLASGNPARYKKMF